MSEKDSRFKVTEHEDIKVKNVNWEQILFSKMISSSGQIDVSSSAKQQQQYSHQTHKNSASHSTFSEKCNQIY